MLEMFIAGIVLGVLLTACADRIRGVRTLRYRVEVDAERELDIVRRAEPEAPRRRRAPSRPRPELAAERTVPVDDTQGTVVAALVGAGYSRDAALKAATACASNERTTVENWTRAALKRALTA